MYTNETSSHSLCSCMHSYVDIATYMNKLGMGVARCYKDLSNKLFYLVFEGRRGKIRMV